MREGSKTCDELYRTLPDKNALIVFFVSVIKCECVSQEKWLYLNLHVCWVCWTLLKWLLHLIFSTNIYYLFELSKKHAVCFDLFFSYFSCHQIVTFHFNQIVLINISSKIGGILKSVERTVDWLLFNVFVAFFLSNT